MLDLVNGLRETLWLLPIAFFTSTLAAVLGLGGGVLLIVLMSGFVPIQALLPLHAAVQLASNSSRAAFAWRHIDFSLIPWISGGGLLGAIIGGEVYQHIDLRILSAVVGALILVITWVKLPTPAGASHFSLVLLGAYQTGLGMITGATGPLGAAVLMQHDQRREWIVINTAVYMSISHGLRLGAFAFLGFVFTPYLLLLAGMIVAVTVGSWMGTRLRQYVSATDFLFWFRILVSLLALRMIAAAMLPYI